jgi:hypothetical protein
MEQHDDLGKTDYWVWGSHRGQDGEERCRAAFITNPRRIGPSSRRQGDRPCGVRTITRDTNEPLVEGKEGHAKMFYFVGWRPKPQSL